MNELQIVIDGEIFSSNQSANLITKLYLCYRDICFPGDQWTDFVDILNIWSCTLLRHSGESEADFILYFMDGPFRLDVAKDKDMKLTIKCVNFRKEEIIQFIINCDFVELLGALYQATKRVSEMMFENTLIRGKNKSTYKQFILTNNKLKTAIDKL